MSLKKMGKYLVVGIVGIFVATTGVNAASMPDAVDGKITLTGNLELTETFTVAEDETITLDLAGYTITGSADIDYYTIENNGNLTIIDSGKTKGKIVCLEDNSSCIINNNELLVDGVFATSSFATIKNEETGNLTVKNATIETTRVGNSQTVGFTGALQNWGTAKVMDSTILAENEYVKELLAVLKENPSPSGRDFAEMVAHVGELENRLAEAVEELRTMRQELLQVQNRSLKAVLQRSCKALEQNISNMSRKLS